MANQENNQVEFLPVIDGVVRENGIVEPEDFTKTITYTKGEIDKENSRIFAAPVNVPFVTMADIRAKVQETKEK